MMKEIWKNITTHPGYQVSNLGRVRSIDRILTRRNRWGVITKNKHKGKILKTRKPCGTCRYEMVSLGVGPKLFVHRLVASEFCDNPLKNPQVNHINANILDNRACNLEWVTSSENMRHARTVGGLKNYHGSNIHNCRINEEKAFEVKTVILKNVNLGNGEIAKLTGVPSYIVYKIRNNKTWRHINVEGWEEYKKTRLR